MCFDDFNSKKQVVISVDKELEEKINDSKFGPISDDNNIEQIIIRIIKNALSCNKFLLESTYNASTFITEFTDKMEAQKEFGNRLYKHLSDNRWITSDKRSIKEIIDSGIFVDFNFKLELKQVE